MAVMFFNGLDFPVNSLNPRHTHAELIFIRRDRCHVVLIPSCVMKLARPEAGPYYIHNHNVCQQVRVSGESRARWQ